jgi:hypothetical protein
MTTYVFTQPQAMATAATDLAGIGSGLSAAYAAAVPTTTVVAAAGDEVSAAIASLFSGHAQSFRALGARAAAFHEQFVQALASGGSAYSGTEAANAAEGLIFIDAVAGTVTTVERIPQTVKTAERTLVLEVGTQVATDEEILLGLKKEGE